MTGLPHIKVPSEVCSECITNKQSINSFVDFVPSKSKNPLEIIYSDVCGPFELNSIGGNKYFVTFINDFTRNV